MTREQAIRVLSEHMEELRAQFQVKSLALFGSVVRGEGTDTSDVDLLVEFSRPVGLFHVVRTQQRLAEVLGVKEVDLVMRRAVVPELRDRIFAEAVDVA